MNRMCFWGSVHQTNVLYERFLRFKELQPCFYIVATMKLYKNVFNHLFFLIIFTKHVMTSPCDGNSECKFSGSIKTCQCLDSYIDINGRCVKYLKVNIL